MSLPIRSVADSRSRIGWASACGALKGSRRGGWPGSRWGLVPRLVGLVGLATLVAGGLVGALLVGASRTALREQIFSSGLATTDLAAEFASRYVEGAVAAIDVLAGDEDVIRAVHGGDPAQATPEVRRFLERNAQRYNGVSLFTVEGFSAAPPAVNVADREWFQQAMGTRRPHFGEPIVSRATGRSVLPYAVPIITTGGNVGAILLGTISLDALSHAITTLDLGPEARASLVDLRQGGVFLVDADPSRVLQVVPSQDPPMQRLLASERGAVELPNSQGELTVSHFAPVPDLPWSVLIQQPSRAAFESVDTLTRRTIWLIVAIVLGATLLAVALALHTTRPLAQLSRAADALAAGDLTRRVRISRRDEIGDLGRAFDHMAGALEERTVQLEQVNRELESFSYSVSHDLRAPLRAIDGFSRMLVTRHSEQLSEEATRYLQLVRDATTQMGQLIDELLRFSRLGRQSLNLEIVAPTTIARQALAQLQVDVSDRLVEVSIADLPTCRADPSLLKQVFMNLLSNALKFTRQRSPAVIEVGCRRNGGERAYFVKDNGVGFDMAYQHKLFGVFQRLHLADEYEGSGVGLAIVNLIIQRHGGRVWAEGKLDQGATFWFTLAERDVDGRT
jgi:signal transduction histidine kinase